MILIQYKGAYEWLGLISLLMLVVWLSISIWNLRSLMIIITITRIRILCCCEYFLNSTAWNRTVRISCNQKCTVFSTGCELKHNTCLFCKNWYPNSPIYWVPIGRNEVDVIWNVSSWTDNRWSIPANLHCPICDHGHLDIVRRWLLIC